MARFRIIKVLKNGSTDEFHYIVKVKLHWYSRWKYINQDGYVLLFDRVSDIRKYTESMGYNIFVSYKVTKRRNNKQ